MRIFITSDQHFSHKNLLKISNLRSELFSNIDEMNQFYIDVWNQTVKEDDLVYQLGDFYIGSDREEYLDILNRLNGNIIFVKGNHDNRKFVNLAKRLNYEYHDVATKIKFNKKNIFLSHYPINIDPWPYKEDQTNINIHGHIHEEIPEKYNQFNACVDVNFNKYGQPIELQKILRKF